MSLIRGTNEASEILELFTNDQIHKLNRYFRDNCSDYRVLVTKMSLDEDLFFDKMELGFTSVVGLVTVDSIAVPFNYDKGIDMVVIIDNDTDESPYLGFLDIFKDVLNKYCNNSSKELIRQLVS